MPTDSTPPKTPVSKKPLSLRSEIAAARAHMPTSIIARNNFIGGMAWGFGTVIGATVLVGLLGFFIGLYGDIPVLGRLIEVIARVVREGTGRIP